MPATIVLVSGHICSGKSRLTAILQELHGFQLFKTSKHLDQEFRKRSRGRPDRYALQRLGDDFDNKTKGKWIYDAVMSQYRDGLPKGLVIDAVRIPEQISFFRSDLKFKTVHVHLYAPTAVLQARFQQRKSEGRERDRKATFQKANLNKTEQSIDNLSREADISIDTSRSDPHDVYVRVGARIGLFASPSDRLVDVLVGGQYGSEGKGQVSAYLAKEYDVLLRVGGPNAGHKVISPSGEYTYHHLPSGCRDTNALVLIGAGAVVNPEKLSAEIQECGRTPVNTKIDPNVMCITAMDIESEAKLKKEISSTGQGVGSATARKIIGRSDRGLVLAKDHTLLRPFVSSVSEQLEQAYAAEKRILLEGTQGSGLSLHHGSYPHVTSRDTNVAGCLAEAGISPSRIDKILMVVRPYPIRVADSESGKTSGYMKMPIDVEVIAERSGLDAEILRAKEVTSTTGRPRRFAEFDWELFRRSCALNAPTDIVLTFSDYIDKRNQEARRFEQLTEETVMFIEEIERVAHAPVSLVSTRFSTRSVIDRRDWIRKRK